MSKEGSSFGKRLSRFIIVISAVGIGLRLWSKGMIGAEKLVIFLVLVVIAAAIDSVWVKLILAFAGVGYFLLDFTSYNMTQFQAVSASVGALLFALFGIYVMVGGMRKRK
jgi:hypothetical protein